jgi:Adenylate and Guanylate cyclase catalytic domain
VDGVLVGVIALLGAGFVLSQGFLHGPAGHKTFGPAAWTWRTIAGAACAPAAVVLWQRRRHPVAVLALALALNLAIYPFPSLLGMVALYSAASRLPPRSSLLAWTAATACFAVGRAVAGGSSLAEVAELVQASPSALSLNQEVEATVVFSDIRGFSTLAERLAPRQVGELIRLHLGAMAEIVAAHGGMLDKFAGDAVMAVFGTPARSKTMPSTRCAAAWPCSGARPGSTLRPPARACQRATSASGSTAAR